MSEPEWYQGWSKKDLKAELEEQNKKLSIAEAALRVRDKEVERLKWVIIEMVKEQYSGYRD